MSVWKGVADAFIRAAHKHRWSRTWVFEEREHCRWRACACGQRDDQMIPMMEWAWRRGFIDSNPR